MPIFIGTGATGDAILYNSPAYKKYFTTLPAFIILPA
jgi:hypothetical protein